MEVADREREFVKDRVAMMAHDLERPALSVIEQLDELLDGTDPLTQKQRGLLSKARASAAFMRELIEDVEAATRLREGCCPAVKCPHDLRWLVNDAVERCSYPAAAKSITLLAELPDAAVQATVDRGMILQLLCNLISNAIKFSNSGTTVRVGVRRVASGAECWVTDQGQGMEPQELPHLFRRFPRVATRATRGEPGTGLGLFIVAEVLRLHHGTIRVTTEPGKGSTFSFHLPKSRVPKAASRRRAPRSTRRGEAP